MIPVEGGSFLMGDAGDGFLKASRPVHRVTVDPFLLGRCQVTQGEWAEIAGENRSVFRGGALPVEMVSWEEAVRFCNARSVREGLAPCYGAGETDVTCDFGKDGFRLPTEAEWEYAARGGRTGAGFPYSGSGILDEVGWYKRNSGGRTHEVGSKKPNGLGLFDMSGNVWEWCWDSYGPYPDGPAVNPRGPEGSPGRVYRGGSWVDFDYGCTVSVRGHRPQSRRYNDIGLRLARTRLD